MNRRTQTPTIRAKLKDWISNIQYCNPPKAVCSHLIGKNHTFGHRLFVGGVIMMLGVMTAKIGGGFLDQILPHGISFLGHWTADLVGYLGHGIGAMPIVEKIAEELSE